MAKLTSGEQKAVLAALRQQAAAWLLGIQPRTLREQDAPRNNDGTYNARECLQWICDRQLPDDGGEIETSQLTGKQRLEQAQADLAEMKRDQQAGRLVARETINACLAELAGALRSLGERLARTGSISGKEVQRMINDLLSGDRWDL